MSVRYNPLWKMLIDRKMTRSEMRIGAGISTRVLARMGKDEDVSTEVLSKICTFLHCELNDIIELVPDEEKTPEAGEKAK
ncbi:MAG: helix-turn-helix transcriptional regulator [Clostridia bacterium]|nr:helix-turn-helix transcriptional regulator [Clostridia bacterium]